MAFGRSKYSRIEGRTKGVKMLLAKPILIALLLIMLVQFPVGAEKQIRTAFVFHFNQSMVPYAEVAEEACYVGLLEMLRGLKPTPFVLHISGTLLYEWLWTESPALELVKEGVADGQFELLGSTLSQNIIYSVDSAVDNQMQIKLHRQLIEHVFGVSPVGFWNPERVWDPELTDLIAGNGYRYTFVEIPILSASGVWYPRIRGPHLVSGSEHDLVLIPDDIDFRNAVNGRDPVRAVSYLKVLNRRDEDDIYLVVYAEDAEATGLWDLEAGRSPAAAWESMRRVLVRLIEEPQVRITKISDFLVEKQQHAKPITTVPGQASWMIGPSVEKGYADWFDYNANASDIKYVRNLYNEISEEISRVEGLVGEQQNQAVGNLIKHARHTLAIAQYEFAAVGAGTKGVSMWELARTALVPAYAAELILTGSYSGPIQADVNRDGVTEVVLVSEDNLYVLSPIGGKLLYWFDLKTGDQLVGSENTCYYGEQLVNDSTYLPPLRLKDPLWPWLPMSEYLDSFVHREYVLRRRVANDLLLTDTGVDYSIVDLPYEVTVDSERVTFSADTEKFSIQKVYSVDGDGLVLEYRVENVGSQANSLRIENGFAPSYLSLLRDGPSVLDIQHDEDAVEIINSGTGLTIMLTHPTNAEVARPGLMRYGEQVDLVVPLPFGADTQFGIRLAARYRSGAGCK